MLEFKEVFPKGHNITHRDTQTIMKCKNIDFGHVMWPLSCRINTYFGPDNTDAIIYSYDQLMYHIIDNIVDINTYDNDDPDGRYTLFSKIIHIQNKSVISHILNNGGVNNRTFKIIRADCSLHYTQSNLLQQSSKLVKWLTDISFSRFVGYYNLEKYYYILPVLLLVTKTQQKSHNHLPTNIIKYLIIPYIYQ